MRYLTPILTEFAQEKFVLLSGPRQVGKTTLARHWLESKEGLYYNWDVPEHRSKILKRSFLRPLAVEALVLDELHKYHRWKSWIKGLYDQVHERLSVVVTGSARLETFQRSGDSLFGRYERLRLHPFTVGELVHGQLRSPPESWLEPDTEHVPKELWGHLARRSGFPEPFTRDDTRQKTRWSRARRQLLIQQDLRELTSLRMLSLVEHLSLLLPERVGSPLSVNALREELSVAHDTVSSWLDALERLYFCFRIAPFHRRISRALKKERKLYLWDWTEAEGSGPRFENMVASHLLKAVHAWNDAGFGEFELQYFRDKQKREVDFVICDRRRPQVFIEAKQSETILSPSFDPLTTAFPEVPRIQLVDRRDTDRLQHGSRVVDAAVYLSTLP